MRRFIEKIYDAAKNNPNSIILYIITLILGFLLGNRGKKSATEKAYKKGYEDCSKIYEKKLRALTEAFLCKEKSFIKHKKEYEKLLDEYIKIIDKLEKKKKKTEEENKELRFLVDKYKQLILINESVI